MVYNQAVVVVLLDLLQVQRWQKAQTRRPAKLRDWSNTASQASSRRRGISPPRHRNQKWVEKVCRQVEYDRPRSVSEVDERQYNPTRAVRVLSYRRGAVHDDAKTIFQIRIRVRRQAGDTRRDEVLDGKSDEDWNDRARLRNILEHDYGCLRRHRRSIHRTVS